MCIISQSVLKFVTCNALKLGLEHFIQCFIIHMFEDSLSPQAFLLLPCPRRVWANIGDVKKSRKLHSLSKIVGTLWCLLALPLLVCKIWVNCDKQHRENEETGRSEKTVLDGSVPTVFVWDCGSRKLPVRNDSYWSCRGKKARADTRLYIGLKLLLPTLGMKWAVSPRKLSKFKHRQLPPNRVKHENNRSKISEDINDAENTKESRDGQTWRRLASGRVPVLTCLLRVFSLVFGSQILFISFFPLHKFLIS